MEGQRFPHTLLSRGQGRIRTEGWPACCSYGVPTSQAANCVAGIGTGMLVVPSRSMAHMALRRRRARDSMAWTRVLPSARLRS